jgi:hypothetical protein
LSDTDTALLLFAGASSLAAIKAVKAAGLSPGGFNWDCYSAIGIARHYLGRPDGWGQVIDLYTQGFVHPLLYVPIIWLLSSLEVPTELQDGIAISLVYAIAMGGIALLAYLCNRLWLRRSVAAAIAVVAVGTILVKPTGDFDAISPNGEILGSVLLLAYWWVLLQRDRLLHYTSLAAAIGVLTLHLKYQLGPQLLVFTALAGLPRRRALVIGGLVIGLFVLSDLLVYRLNGYGLISRLGSLLSDYSLGGRSGAGAGSPPDRMAQIPAMLNYYPTFSLAWICWLPAILVSPADKKGRIRHLTGALLLSLVTVAAILIPGKNFSHYYLLLVPTTVMVMGQALRQNALFCR